MESGLFNNVGYIENSENRLMILSGGRDDVTPFNEHAQKLYDRASNPKSLNRVEAAGHYDLPFAMGEQAYIDIVNAFVRGS